MEYPYLGERDFNGKKVVVMFTDENEGTVVLNETDNKDYRFGLHGEFNEEKFDFFPPEKVVRIQN